MVKVLVCKLCCLFSMIGEGEETTDLGALDGQPDKPKTPINARNFMKLWLLLNLYTIDITCIFMIKLLVD